MKLPLGLCGLGLTFLLLAGSGCRNNTVALPTDDDARKRAEAPLPPPIQLGEKGSNPSGKDSPLTVRGADQPGEKK